MCRAAEEVVTCIEWKRRRKRSKTYRRKCRNDDEEREGSSE
jgi:hypothetical protein